MQASAEKEEKPKPKISPPKIALSLVLFTIFMDMAAIGIIIPLYPKLMEEISHTNLSSSSIYSGWMQFSYSFVQFLCLPLLGVFSDRYGRRPLILLAILGLSLDFFMTAWAPNLFWLFLSRILAGMMGASVSIASAYIADISSPKNLAQNFGLMGAMTGMGFVVGPAIGGLLGAWGLRFPFYFAGGVSLLNFSLCLFFLPESLPKEKRKEGTKKQLNPFLPLVVFLKKPEMLFFGTIHFLTSMGDQVFFSVWTFFSMARFGWDEKAVGIALSYFGFLVFLFQGFLVKPISKKFSVSKIIIWGLSIEIFCFICTGFVTQGWLTYLINALVEVGAIFHVVFLTFISSKIPSNEQGELQGNMNAIFSLTSILGPILMTSVFYLSTQSPEKFYQPGAPFFCSALFYLAALVLVRRYFQKNGRLWASTSSSSIADG